MTPPIDAMSEENGQPDDTARRSRRWHGLHRATWCVVLLVSVVVFLLNVPGTLVYGICQVGVYEHGWPWTYMDRSAILESYFWPCELSWVDWQAWCLFSGVTRFRPILLVLDGFVAILLVWLAGAAMEWRCRRLRRWQFTVAELLMLMLLLAGSLGYHRMQQIRYEQQEALIAKYESEDARVFISAYVGPKWWWKLFGPHPQSWWGITDISVPSNTPAATVSELFSEIEEFRHVQLVSISEHSVPTDTFDALGRIRSLRRVNLRRVPLTDADWSHIADWRQLTELSLAGTTITNKGLEHIGGLTNLESLNLSDMEIDDSALQHLSGLKNLRGLGLGWNKINGDGLCHLKNLRCIESLGLGDTQVDDEALKHLSSWGGLQHLNLTGTRVSDAGLVHLYGLQDLERLDICETSVTLAGIQKLRQRLPRCEVARGPDRSNPEFVGSK